MTLARGKRLLQIWLLVLVSLAAALGAMEGALGLVPRALAYQAWHERSLTYLEDSQTDWRLEPRRYPWGQVNRYGFRGPEIPQQKSPGTCRIVVVGGSAAFDLWKRDGETWGDRLEGRLARALPCRVEVMNTGTLGLSRPRPRPALGGLPGGVGDQPPRRALRAECLPARGTASGSAYSRVLPRRSALDRSG